MRRFPKHPSRLPLPPMVDWMARPKLIKFRASWVDPNSYGLVKAKEVVFEHGLGPCGRHVVDLAFEVTPELLTVKQWSRSPELLHEPLCTAEWKLRRHYDAERRYQPLVTLRRPPEVIVTGFLWWRKGILIQEKGIQYGDAAKHPDILEPEEVERLKGLAEQYNRDRQAWQDDLELKTFTYKMTDVHGRIETVK